VLAFTRRPESAVAVDRDMEGIMQCNALQQQDCNVDMVGNWFLVFIFVVFFIRREEKGRKRK
jgi:hypothetical protein